MKSINRLICRCFLWQLFLFFSKAAKTLSLNPSGQPKPCLKVSLLIQLKRHLKPTSFHRYDAQMNGSILLMFYLAVRFHCQEKEIV